MPFASSRSLGLIGENSTPMRTWFGPGASGAGMSIYLRASTGNNAVDDVPSFERRRVVLVGGIDDLSGTARAGALGEALNAAEQRRGADRCLRLSEACGGASPDEIAGQGEFEPRREAEPLDRGQRRTRQFFEVGNRSQMASNPLTSVGGRSSLENADVGASREDLAFSPNQQGSERGLLCRSHGASQVFDELLAEQVQGEN